MLVFITQERVCVTRDIHRFVFPFSGGLSFNVRRRLGNVVPIEENDATFSRTDGGNKNVLETCLPDAFQSNVAGVPVHDPNFFKFLISL